MNSRVRSSVVAAVSGFVVLGMLLYCALQWRGSDLDATKDSGQGTAPVCSKGSIDADLVSRVSSGKTLLDINVVDDAGKHIEGAVIKVASRGGTVPLVEEAAACYSLDLSDVSLGSTVSLEGEAAGHASRSLQLVRSEEQRELTQVTLRLPRLSALKLTVETEGGSPEAIDVAVCALTIPVEAAMSNTGEFFRRTPTILEKKVVGNELSIDELDPEVGYMLRIQAGGCAESVVPVQALPPGECKHLLVRLEIVRLESTTSLRVVAVFPDAKPVQGYSVDLVEEIETGPQSYSERCLGSSTTGTDGVAEFMNVSAGRKWVVLQNERKGHCYMWTTAVDLEQGLGKTVTIVVSDKVLVRVRVLDSAGSALAGHLVRLRDQNSHGYDIKGRTDAEGWLAFEGVPLGSNALVCVSDENDIIVVQEEFELPEKEDLVEKTYLITPFQPIPNARLVVSGTRVLHLNDKVKFALYYCDSGTLHGTYAFGYNMMGSKLKVECGDWPFGLQSIRYGNYRIEALVTTSSGERVWGIVPRVEVAAEVVEVVVALWVSSRPVSGRVLDSEGSPVRGAEVERLLTEKAKRGLERVYTDDDGYFLLSVPDVVGERFFLRVRARSLVAGETAQKEIVMSDQELSESRGLVHVGSGAQQRS